MSLIALLSARAPALADGPRAPHLRAALNFGGQTLVEYQARQAIDAGARQILIHVDAATPELARAVDRLSADGLATVSLVRDLYTLARTIGPEDRVLAIGDGIVVPQSAVAAIVAADAPRLLVTPIVAATSRFERIDMRDAWAGLSCVPGATLLRTIDMLGEWDLALTLVRVAVQEGARRTELSPEHAMEGHLVLVSDQTSADLALVALSAYREPMGARRPGLDRHVFAQLTRPLVAEMVRRQMDGGRIAYAALGLAVVALGLALSAWSIPALALGLVSCGGLALAREIGLVTRRMAVARWQVGAVAALCLALIGIAGTRAGAGDLLSLAGAWLPPLLAAILALRAQRPDDAPLPWWGWITVPIALGLVLLGALVGATGAAIAIVGLIALADVGALLLLLGLPSPAASASPRV